LEWKKVNYEAERNESANGSKKLVTSCTYVFWPLPKPRNICLNCDSSIPANPCKFLASPIAPPTVAILDSLGLGRNVELGKRKLVGSGRS
jgi:hypothetical protein